MAGTKKENAPVTPDPEEFAVRLVVVFGGEDSVLNEEETTTVLRFLQAHLPEQTGPTGLSNRLSRESNVHNASRNDMTDERHALREYAPEQYVTTFLKKYDRNKDGVLEWHELTKAIAKVTGVPERSKDWKKHTTVDRK